MKKLAYGAGFAMATAVCTAVSSIPAAVANPLSNEAPFLISQAILEPTGDSADFYAFVESFDGQTLSARLPDGTTQDFTLPEGIGGVDDLSLNPGDLIAINANRDNVISGLDNPVVDTEFVGSVSAYENGELAVTSSVGQAENFAVSEELISRLNIQPGDEVKVTSFQNVPGVSSICKVERAELPPPAPATAPQIFTPPPAPAPAIAPVIEGLW